jgi:hypothetical protein
VRWLGLEVFLGKRKALVVAIGVLDGPQQLRRRDAVLYGPISKFSLI